MEDFTLDRWIERVLKDAQERAGDLQPWDDHYRLRAEEVGVLLSMHNVKKAGRILEIGCGNGFVSALLSCLAGEVVATDLSEIDARTHSIGISKAEELLKRLGIKNVEVVSCDGERLPFKDGTFDMVFCLYTLEHSKDRDLFMREVRRVLKGGCEAIFLVPGFMERALYPFVYYSQIAAKVLRMLFTKDRGTAASDKAAALQSRTLWRKFKDGYPCFPAPDPHGEYPNYFIELAKMTPCAWFDLMRDNRLKVKKSFTTMLFPKSFSSIFTGRRSLELYIRTLWLNKKIGKWPFLKYFGQNLCLVLKDDNG